MSFTGLVARESSVAFEPLTDDELPKGGVTIDVALSSLNYKDALAVTRRGKIVRRFPMVLGIDLAGTVVDSDDPRFKTGDLVLGTGQGLGESTWGGYTTRERVPADAIVPVPGGLTLEQAMQLGTAGITAMLCVMALEQHGVVPGHREVVVTGAAGGVGSIAVLLLARLGYRVTASTGRAELEPYLRELGATAIIPRDELSTKGAPMQKERWAGGIDTVGGVTLENVFAQTAYGGGVASCGMAGGHELNIAVWPLILRNVSLLGVSSILTPWDTRVVGWNRLAQQTRLDRLAALSRTEKLTNVFPLAEELLAGKVRGRIVLDVHA